VLHLMICLIEDGEANTLSGRVQVPAEFCMVGRSARNVISRSYFATRSMKTCAAPVAATVNRCMLSMLFHRVIPVEIACPYHAV
jgi:hypothetical protein